MWPSGLRAWYSSCCGVSCSCSSYSTPYPRNFYICHRCGCKKKKIIDKSQCAIRSCIFWEKGNTQQVLLGASQHLALSQLPCTRLCSPSQPSLAWLLLASVRFWLHVLLFLLLSHYSALFKFPIHLLFNTWFFIMYSVHSWYPHLIYYVS